MSRRSRLFRLFRGPTEDELTADAPGLAVVAEAFDPAEADSAVLARSHRWQPARKAVLRHHLRLPAGRMDEAAKIVSQDGYQLRPASPSPAEPAETGGSRRSTWCAYRCWTHCTAPRNEPGWPVWPSGSAGRRWGGTHSSRGPGPNRREISHSGASTGRKPTSRGAPGGRSSPWLRIGVRASGREH